MTKLIKMLFLASIGLMCGCSDNPIEKCVEAQVKLAAETAEWIAAQPPPPPLTVFEKMAGIPPLVPQRPETPTEAEARARIMCLKAGGNKG